MSLVTLMAINDAHHALEMLDAVDGGFDGLYPLRLNSILSSLAESRRIKGQHLSFFHLGLDRVPQLLHLIPSRPESEPDGFGSHPSVRGVPIIPSGVAFLVSTIEPGKLWG